MSREIKMRRDHPDHPDLPATRKVGHVHLSPQDAQRIIDADHGSPCCYWHYDCATLEGGLCSNEVAAEFADDPRVETGLED